MLKLDKTRVAQAIRQAREKAGLTQARLAEAAGIAEQSLSRLERGAYEPALSTVWSIAQVLGVTLDALVGGTAKPQRTGDDNERVGLMTLADSLGGLPPRTASLFTKLAQEFIRTRAAPLEPKGRTPRPRAR
jgi:putative transcriptional regulator